MVGGYKVVTLCDSTRFKSGFLETQEWLTLAENIVISIGMFRHSSDDEVWDGVDDSAISETKRMLDNMHKRKIDMADEVFIINVDKHIGESARSEIECALSKEIPVRYLSD